MHIEKGLSLGYFQDIFLNVIFSCMLCYLKDQYDSDLPPTPPAVPQDGVQPFDTPLVENSPLTPLSQTRVITPSIEASRPFDEHKQLIPLPTTPKELKDLEPLPSVELDDLESAPPSAKQDKFDPSVF